MIMTESSSMIYKSTRGKARELGFKDVIFEGLASDGGLYVPSSWPVLDSKLIESFSDMSYQEIAYHVFKPYLDETISEDTLKEIIHHSYKNFTNNEITPLRKINNNEYLLELFHGPTYAFKDIAMQFISRIMDYYLTRDNSHINILGATSGDTGSAAIYGFENIKSSNVFILHPYNLISPTQRKFMTTINSENIINIAVKGNFDDCQNIIKEIFSDEEYKKSNNLGAINSINWARIMCQITYYFYSASRIKDNENIIYSVPTGNFGDILAGYISKKMGLKFKKLNIATNENNILDRTLRSGDHSIKGVISTTSPSIDIQISSNFERLLFDLLDMSPRVVEKKMSELKESGKFELSKSELESFKNNFDAGSLDQDETVKIIKDIYNRSHQIIDPHTAIAVGVHYKNSYKNSIVLSTAHAAKFPDTVMKAIGINPELPNISEDIYKLHENIIDLPNDVGDINAFITKNFSE